MIGARRLIHEGPSSPIVPGCFKVRGEFGFLLAQVVKLGSVGLHVEEVPGLFVTKNQLPLPTADCLVHLVLPEDRCLPGQRHTLECRSETDTLYGLDGLATELAGIRCAYVINGGRHDVNQVHRPLLQGPSTPRRNARWPRCHLPVITVK